GDAWSVSFKAYDDMPVFNLSRKRERQIQRNGSSMKAQYRWIVAVEEVEPRPARCIAVDSPSHLFLAGDRLIATHNTKRDQAKITWSEAKRMVKKSPVLLKRVRPLVAELVCDFNDGSFKPLSSDSNTLDGLNVHCALIDELHAIQDKNLYDVIIDGMTAREQPLSIITSTAGTVREGIFDIKYDEATRIIDSYD